MLLLVSPRDNPSLMLVWLCKGAHTAGLSLASWNKADLREQQALSAPQRAGGAPGSSLLLVGKILCNVYGGISNPKGCAAKYMKAISTVMSPLTKTSGGLCMLSFKACCRWRTGSDSAVRQGTEGSVSHQWSHRSSHTGSWGWYKGTRKTPFARNPHTCSPNSLTNPFCNPRSSLAPLFFLELCS